MSQRQAATGDHAQVAGRSGESASKILSRTICSVAQFPIAREAAPRTQSILDSPVRVRQRSPQIAAAHAERSTVAGPTLTPRGALPRMPAPCAAETRADMLAPLLPKPLSPSAGRAGRSHRGVADHFIACSSAAERLQHVRAALCDSAALRFGADCRASARPN